MDTKPLESFAKAARSELLTAVEARVSTVLAAGSVARSERAETVRVLESEIAAHGREHVVGKVAYTWFNRLIALRFMDARGYTDAGVVSPASGQAHGQPEILADAKRGVLDPEVVTNAGAHDAIIGLLDGSRRSTDAEGEAYALLLTAYCRHWHKTMPFMFEAEGAYTELLVPAGLLADGALLSRARGVLTEEVCDDVEVIGWLYQFYISERKDEVFAGFKKNKKAGADEIPAATQLFTPHWIVRYLLENSLGRLWMLNRPSSRLVEQMDYYIAPIDEETDFLKVSGPEELTVIDPACGSGHMLTYAFDLLYAIYEEEGHAPSEIPSLILTHNLHGTEIDPRAGALAAFALTMKARAKDRRFFTRSTSLVEPRRNPTICVIEPISFTGDELDLLITKAGDCDAEASFWNQFRDADTFGSLIQPDADATAQAAVVLEGLKDQEGTFYYDTLLRARRVVAQAEMLSRKYAVVTANPPYMGGKQMSALLSQFMKDEYRDSKSDLFAAFIERCTDLARPGGAVAMITMQSWMFLSSYEKLRASLLAKQRITSMLHLGARAFDSIGGEVVSATAFVLANVPPEARIAARLPGTFIRLVDGTSEAEKIAALGTALEARTETTGFHLASDVDFIAIPGSPIVYWLSEKMRGSFSAGKPLSEVANLRQGLATADNNRFLRQWWEVSQEHSAYACTSREEAAASGARWFPYNKGGEFRKWYGNQEHVVNWENDGAEIVDFKPRAVIRNPGTYFSPSVSWSDISSGEAAFRRYPQGFIHDSTGHSGFGEGELLDWITLLLNSKYVMEVMQVVAPTLHFHIGYVGLVPVAPGARDLPSSTLDNLVETSRADWDVSETSWRFGLNPLVALV